MKTYTSATPSPKCLKTVLQKPLRLPLRLEAPSMTRVIMIFLFLLSLTWYVCLIQATSLWTLVSAGYVLDLLW